MHVTTSQHSTSGAASIARRGAVRRGSLTLQIRELLLGHILAGNHVLNDTVNGVENHLVMTQRENGVYLSVQQAVSVNGTTSQCH